jgi:hypothetical protein
MGDDGRRVSIDQIFADIDAPRILDCQPRQSSCRSRYPGCKPFDLNMGAAAGLFQEQDERLRSLGCLAVGADTRGEFRHLCELSWQRPY